MLVAIFFGEGSWCTCEWVRACLRVRVRASVCAFVCLHVESQQTLNARSLRKQTLICASENFTKHVHATTLVKELASIR